MEWIIGAGIAIGAAIGAGIAQWKKNKEEKERAEQQKEYNEKMYKLNKARAETEFAAAKEEAQRQASEMMADANLADKQVDLTENSLSSDFNAAIDNIYYAQEGDAYNWNLQALSNASSEGTAYANIAGSGIRAGSSLSNAVLLESAINEGQLQFAQDSKRKSINNSLVNVLNELAGHKADITSNRTMIDRQRSNAAYLENSFNAGGKNYNLYQNQLEQLKTTNDYNSAALQYTIDSFSGDNAALKVATAAMSQGAVGFQTGYNLGNTIKDSYRNNYGYKGNKTANKG